jgi:hypothetical protein
MKALRIVLVGGALFFLISGIILFNYGWRDMNLLSLMWGINAIVLIIGVIFERSSYKKKTTSEEGWIRTKERFIDNKSGKMVEVYFHPKSGEREYREIR